MRIITITLLLGLAVSQFASARQSVEPVLTGRQQNVQPVDNRCTVSVSNGTIDYGTQSRWQLQESSEVSQGLTPGKRQVMVNVACPYTQEMRLTVHGEPNRRGAFRYGDNGRMHVKIVSAQLDNQPVPIALSTTEGLLLENPTENREIEPEQTFVPVIKGKSAQGKILSFRLDLEPLITDSEARVSSQQISEANISVELR